MDGARARGHPDPAGAGRGRCDRGRALSPLTVEIRGLRVFAHHGVHAFEREHGQTFVIDVWLECPPSPAEASDDLADAIDYSAVCDRVVELATGGPYDLLERLAAVIADDLSGLHPVASVRVRVAKPDAPMVHELREVAVTVERAAIGRGIPPV